MSRKCWDIRYRTVITSKDKLHDYDYISLFNVKNAKMSF